MERSPNDLRQWNYGLYAEHENDVHRIRTVSYDRMPFKSLHKPLLASREVRYIL